MGVFDEMSDKFNLLYSDDKALIAESLEAADAQTPLNVFDEENGVTCHMLCCFVLNKRLL